MDVGGDGGPPSPTLDPPQVTTNKHKVIFLPFHKSTCERTHACHVCFGLPERFWTSAFGTFQKPKKKTPLRSQKPGVVLLKKWVFGSSAHVSFLTSGRSNKSLGLWKAAHTTKLKQTWSMILGSLVYTLYDESSTVVKQAPWPIAS